MEEFMLLQTLRWMRHHLTKSPNCRTSYTSYQEKVAGDEMWSSRRSSGGRRLVLKALLNIIKLTTNLKKITEVLKLNMFLATVSSELQSYWKWNSYSHLSCTIFKGCSLKLSFSWNKIFDIKKFMIINSNSQLVISMYIMHTFDLHCFLYDQLCTLPFLLCILQPALFSVWMHCFNVFPTTSSLVVLASCCPSLQTPMLFSKPAHHPSSTHARTISLHSSLPSEPLFLLIPTSPLGTLSSFTPYVLYHTLLSPLLSQSFSKLPFHFPSNTLSISHITSPILHNSEKLFLLS